jgi:hypothetical protein
MTPTLTLESRLRLSPDVLHRKLEGEVVMLDLTRSAYFGLDAIGARILDLLAEHGRLRDVLDELITEFDVEPAVAEADLLRLMSEMQASGLVSPVPSDGA